MTPRGKTTRLRKVFIVDDHPMMREGLAQMIGNQPDLEVCGEAGDAHEALEKINSLKPDLVLTDITLPGKNGLELIKDIKTMLPQALVLVISMHDETLYVERVLRAGGRGYIMKQEGGKKIAQAIRQVLDGQIWVSEKMSAKILEIFSGHRQEVTASPVGNLTDREFEVFQLIGQGLETKRMAQKLHLSPKTIEVHRASIKAKLKLSSMPELIYYAIRWVESQDAR
jgi:DNA-binding NarL/FixJ family response regulator